MVRAVEALKASDAGLHPQDTVFVDPGRALPVKLSPGLFMGGWCRELHVGVSGFGGPCYSARRHRIHCPLGCLRDRTYPCPLEIRLGRGRVTSSGQRVAGGDVACRRGRGGVEEEGYRCRCERSMPVREHRGQCGVVRKTVWLLAFTEVLSCFVTVFFLLIDTSGFLKMY